MWPWGYFIYRTTSSHVSNADWDKAIQKLDTYVHCKLQARVAYDNLEPVRLVREGYRNVVIDDRSLSGASMSHVRGLFDDWMEEHQLGDSPRSEFFIMIDDKVLRSILDSPEPSIDNIGALTSDPNVGYVMLVDRGFREDAPQGDFEHYRGFWHLDITGLWGFAASYSGWDDLEDIRPYLPRAGLIPCLDGQWARVEDEDRNIISASTFPMRR